MNCPMIKDKLRKDNEERGIEVKIHLTKACYIFTNLLSLTLTSGVFRMEPCPDDEEFILLHTGVDVILPKGISGEFRN